MAAALADSEKRKKYSRRDGKEAGSSRKVEQLREAQSTQALCHPPARQSSARGCLGHPRAEERPTKGQVGAEILLHSTLQPGAVNRLCLLRVGQGEFPVLLKGTFLSLRHEHGGGAFA